MAETVLSILLTLLQLLTYALVGRALLSWFDPRGQWTISRMLAEVTEPVIAPAAAGRSPGRHARSLVHRRHHSHPGAGAVAATGTVVAGPRVHGNAPPEAISGGAFSCKPPIVIKEHCHGTSAGRNRGCWVMGDGVTGDGSRFPAALSASSAPAKRASVSTAQLHADARHLRRIAAPERAGMPTSTREPDGLTSAGEDKSGTVRVSGATRGSGRLRERMGGIRLLTTLYTIFFVLIILIAIGSFFGVFGNPLIDPGL